MGNTIHCPECQFPLAVGAKFCTKCGAKIDDKKPNQCPDCMLN